MGISVDTSTVLLLLAPLLLPKLYSFAAQAVFGLRNKPAPGSDASRYRQQPKGLRSRFELRWSDLPILLVALHSLYSVVYGRPFSFFTSLGPIPVTAPTSKIQAALSWRDLGHKYGEDLQLLTSLDIRALYLHFGHANLFGCYRLLGSAAPKDVLAYSSIQLARTYIIRAILLAYSNRRWKNSILLASAAGFLYEVYALATTDMRLPNRESPIQSLYEYMLFYRNIGFVCASVAAMALPRQQPSKPLSAEEASLVQGIQALIQRQDMLQTRIRVIEAAVSSHVKKEDKSASSHLSAAQKTSLKAWLRSIVEMETAQKSAPSVKVEEVLDEIMPEPKKEEETALLDDALQLPKSESLNIVDESFATAEVVIKRSTSEESLLSPTLSRSSSSSSPIDTPTPAMRRPMSMEVPAATAAQLRDMIRSECSDSDFDQPLSKRVDFTNRLTQSLGPSASVSHPRIPADLEIHEEKPHRRSFSMYGTIPGIREPDEPDQAVESKPDEPDQAVESTSQAAVHEDTRPLDADASRMSSMEEALRLSVLPASPLKVKNIEVSEASSTTDDHQRILETLDKYSSYTDTPPSTLSGSDDDGWTTVHSKKAKHKTQ